MSKALTLGTLLSKCEPSFNKQNDYGLNFAQECHFAKQQITKSDFALNTARNNQASLANAIQNVSAIGISLNPATADAYLVPRDKQICLDISYRGMVKLAVESGAIVLAKAVLVYEGDTFNWKGPLAAPEHIADVFKADRINPNNPLENLLGGYCIAVLPDGRELVDFMTAGEILAVRDSSKAKNGPWQGKWAGEMAKKTLVKRASKSWPTGQRARLERAIHVLNEHEGLEDDAPADEKAIEAFMDMVAREDGMGLLLFSDTYGERNKIAAYNAAPSGEKTKLKNAASALERAASDQIDVYVDLIAGALEVRDGHAIEELFAELEPQELDLVNRRLTDIQHRQIRDVRQEVAA